MDEETSQDVGRTGAKSSNRGNPVKSDRAKTGPSKRSPVRPLIPNILPSLPVPRPAKEAPRRSQIYPPSQLYETQVLEKISTLTKLVLRVLKYSEN